jgi:hypothetical protein
MYRKFSTDAVIKFDGEELSRCRTIRPRADAPAEVSLVQKVHENAVSKTFVFVGMRALMTNIQQVNIGAEAGARNWERERRISRGVLLPIPSRSASFSISHRSQGMCWSA